VAVLCGPPEFFSNYLHDDDIYHGVLYDSLKEKLTDQLKIDFLAFEGMKEVRLSILMAGINPPRLAEICNDALGEWPTTFDDLSLADWLRNYNSETIENLLTQEIRTVLEKRIEQQKEVRA